MTIQATPKYNRNNLPSKWTIIQFWNQFELTSTPDDRCMACLRNGVLERAHILAHADGGGENLENLHVLCRACHYESESQSGVWYWLWFSEMRKSNDWKKAEQLVVHAKLAHMLSDGKNPLTIGEDGGLTAGESLKEYWSSVTMNPPSFDVHVCLSRVGEQSIYGLTPAGVGSNQLVLHTVLVNPNTPNTRYMYGWDIEFRGTYNNAGEILAALEPNGFVFVLFSLGIGGASRISAEYTYEEYWLHVLQEWIMEAEFNLPYMALDDLISMYKGAQSKFVLMANAIQKLKENGQSRALEAAIFAFPQLGVYCE